MPGIIARLERMVSFVAEEEDAVPPAVDVVSGPKPKLPVSTTVSGVVQDDSELEVVSSLTVPDNFERVVDSRILEDDELEVKCLEVFVSPSATVSDVVIFVTEVDCAVDFERADGGNVRNGAELVTNDGRLAEEKEIDDEGSEPKIDITGMIL
ncbi:hypothetical protein B0H10DRAFT_1960482 [Mycena sp. CBHHK59/15]|nr:hypothetical protein B0H10DRAFT_1973273 [Mycena sp. CBHHK59/15]KAJ6562928.1 hypothetical protein B0H10DRAFT_1966398 [Mycena sp. CBHHK59/15]KAJ6562949.1 hypothetical protein B0H10DRAFT_1966359 [Mycena sp. CBHHK59/15]KAJ6579035.1 hypothetical protein B0H10DRAFT_1963102 [Mycena sp. CBHHK59/15]KAJ6595328.1 hypothetical protein B0H10DRAFT_1960482 [Mycena sp. CBHHK59/15]